MVISGHQDIYLTIDPEITFFKKVYRRHTNFSTELIEILPEQPANFDNKITFMLNRGDAIHRCYFEITLPTYSFSDKYVTNQKYIDKKNFDISKLTNELTLIKNQYENLKGFVDIELQLFRILSNFLDTDNVTINNLKDQVVRFNYKNKLTKDQFKNKIDETIFENIDMTGYINGLTKLITTSTTYDTTKFISKQQIHSELKKKYDTMINYLNGYNKSINDINIILEDKQQPNQIDFNFAEYLGHNFFESVNLEIGGNEFDSYSKDILHINQMHSISEDYMDNYLKMIGHVPEFINYNDYPKGGRKILVLGKKYIVNQNLLFTSRTLDEINDSINYFCPLINFELLKIKFPDMSNAEINTVLTSNGSELTLGEITKILNPNMSDTEISTLNGSSNSNKQWVINKIQWIKFLANMRDSKYSSFIYKIFSYYPYINYELYTSLVDVPDVKLICESIFMDDVERAKFAGSKLEYVIEKYYDDFYTIKNKNFFDCEISFTNPCKELLWYIQPQLFVDGLSGYNQNKNLKFNVRDDYENNIITKQKIVINQHDVLLENVDSNYYTYLLSYKYLNNILPEGIYYHSFCLYPEETQPSGTANFRVIKGKQFIINFNSAWLKEYTDQLKVIFTTEEEVKNKSVINLKIIGKIYDLFVVSNGKADLTFN